MEWLAMTDVHGHQTIWRYAGDNKLPATMSPSSKKKRYRNAIKATKSPPPMARKHVVVYSRYLYHWEFG